MHDDHFRAVGKHAFDLDQGHQIGHARKALVGVEQRASMGREVGDGTPLAGQNHQFVADIGNRLRRAELDVPGKIATRNFRSGEDGQAFLFGGREQHGVSPLTVEFEPTV